MDAGGPRRDFLRLLAEEVAKAYFNNGFLINNIVAVQVRLW